LLGITQNGRINKAIYCYNKCIIREDETEIVFDPIKKSLMVRASYYGKGNVYFQVYNARQESVYKSGILEQGVEYEVFSLNSFEKYTICFYEKPRGLALNNYVLLKSYERIFYAREDFVNRSFKVNEVYFNQLVRGEFVERFNYLKKVYVYFIRRLSDSAFLGEIYIQSPQGACKLKQINPVEIEICSDAIDGTMDLYMTKDGDGLLLDFENHRIMDTIDDSAATDIFSYTINLM
jgi:hypothetical protein